MTWTAEVIRDEAGWQAIEAEWLRLWQTADAPPFVHPGFVRGASLMQEGLLQPRLLLVRDEYRELAALLPLGLHIRRFARLPLSRLVALAGPQTTYLELLAREEAMEKAGEAVLRGIAGLFEEGDQVALRPFEPGSFLGSLLDRAGPGGKRLHRRDQALSLNLPGDTPDWRYLFTAKQAHDFERLRRKAAREVGATISRLEASDPRFDFAVKRFMEVHTRRWTGRAQLPSSLAGPSARREFPGLVRTSIAAGFGRFYVFGSEEEFLAGLWVLTHRDRMYAHRVALNTDFARYSPGTLVFLHTIGEALNERFASYDFGWGSEQYKYKFDPVARDVFEYVASRRPWKLAWAKGMTWLSESRAYRLARHRLGHRTERGGR